MQDEELLAHDSSHSTGLLRSAGLIVVVILLSKIAGFLRDVIVANYYGASIVSGLTVSQALDNRAKWRAKSVFVLSSSKHCWAA